MSKNCLIVIDMQNDFIDGALGTKEAQAIVPYVAEKIRNFDGPIIFTKDTHFMTENPFCPAYEDSLEGKLLPVPHCLMDADGNPTNGHNINDEVWAAASVKSNKLDIIGKCTFGSPVALPAKVNQICPGVENIEVCGLCTDICVVSNALILRACFPNVPMIVDSKACAGVTPAKHEAALEVMRSCQIEVI